MARYGAPRPGPGGRLARRGRPITIPRGHGTFRPAARRRRDGEHVRLGDDEARRRDAGRVRRGPGVCRVVSAHRTPALLAAFATAAEGRGVRVVIAGAGGAAHLPGMMAAHTAVPVRRRAGGVGRAAGRRLAAEPSCRCRPAVPVATVAIGRAGAVNAGPCWPSPSWPGPTPTFAASCTSTVSGRPTACWRPPCPSRKVSHRWGTDEHRSETKPASARITRQSPLTRRHEGAKREPDTANPFQSRVYPSCLRVKDDVQSAHIFGCVDLSSSSSVFICAPSVANSYAFPIGG